MKKTAENIIVTAAIIAAVVVVILVITSWKKMKQTVQGIASGNFFSDAELMHSDTAKKYGINNTPSPAAWANLHALRDAVLNPARQRLGSYILVNCAYRCKALNDKLRELGQPSSETSQHMTGEAADITAGSVAKNRELFRILVSLGNFDQLIWEKGGQWIHVSYKRTGGRAQMLSWNGSKYININSNWENAIA